MTPKEYKQMMDYLTRSGVRKQVKFASDLAKPVDKFEVQQIKLFNEFNKRNPKADGGMLVQPGFGGTRQGYKKDNPGSVYKDGNGYTVKIGSASNPNTITKYFGAKKYGSLEKAKKAAETFRVKEAKDFEFKPQGPQTGKQAAAEKAIQELLDEGKEVTTAAVKEKLPKNLQKDFSGSKTYFSKAKKSFPNLDFKKSPRVFLKAPKDIAKVSKLIEDGLPLKEIQAKGFDVKFIKRVAKVNNLKIAETSYDYYENVKKITNDLTKIGKNKKIVEAFENGTVSKDLIDKVGKVTKSNDPFYDSRLLFKLAEYYDGSLEEWYKPKLPAATKNQIANSDKVIKTSATFLGGKRNGYAYQNFLYDWGAKKIDKVLDLPLGTFRGIQRDIARTLPSGISLDEVFGVKSSGRFAPIEGIFTNPLESGANVDKGSFVDNVKSNYQKQLVDASGNPKKQKEILKDYNDVVQKSKVRYPDVEFPNYKVGQPPNKTIKGFDKLPPLIQSRLLESYKTTGISPVTKKAVSIFDVAKATGSKTFGKLDKSVQASLSNVTETQTKQIAANLRKLGFKCKFAKADGGRIGLSTGTGRCDDPMSYVDDIKKQEDLLKVQTKTAPQAVKTLNTARKLNAVRSLFTSTLGPGALAFEAAAALPIAYMGYKGGKTPENILADSTFNLIGKSDKRVFLDKAVEMGFDTANIKRAQDLLKKQETFEKQDARADEFMGPDDLFMYPQMVQKAERDLLDITKQFIDQETGKVIPERVEAFKQLPLVEQAVVKDQADLAAKRQEQVGNVLQRPITDYLPGLAGGGIAKLAGVSSGPPPESGPNSQGLQGLMKRVKKL